MHKIIGSIPTIRKKIKNLVTIKSYHMDNILMRSLPKLRKQSRAPKALYVSAQQKAISKHLFHPKAIPGQALLPFYMIVYWPMISAIVIAITTNVML